MAITTHGTMATERVSKTRFHFAHLMSRNPCEITINGIIKHMKKVRERERITHLHDKLASIGTLKRENVTHCEKRDHLGLCVCRM